MMTQVKRRAALLGAAATLVAGIGVAGVVTAHAASAGCSVSYSVASQWSSGFSANVSVTNLGDALSSWTVKFSFSAGQQVTQAWNATVTQSGSQVTAVNESYNGSLGTGANTSFGFNGSWNNSSNPNPTSFTLNGVTCTGAVSGSPTASKTAGASASPTKSAGASASPTRSAGPSPTGTTPSVTWPTKTGDVTVSGTISVAAGQTMDGGMKRYCCIGTGSQSESQPEMFDLADGATLKNVIIGSPAGDGVHCEGRCTIQNVWWEDVGEDAATFKGTNGDSYVIGGGAKAASDKVFQHNGSGTVHISGFYAQTIGKLYRACGNCSSSYQRHVTVDNVILDSASYVVGININWGDTATLTHITLINGSKTHICAEYQGVAKGSEPPYLGDGVNDAYCHFTSADITYK
jgi:pectate lyase